MVGRSAGLLSALLCTALRLWALDPNRAVSQYQKATWQVEDGLPQNAVRALVQDGDGSLLVGTSGGLLRFDGRRFQAMPQGSGLSSPEGVNTMILARDGTLWAGLESGDLVRRHDDVTRIFRKEDGIAGGTIRSIFEDQSGNVWVASRFGITRIHESKPEILPGVPGIVPPMPSVFADTGGAGVVIATERELWLYRSGRLRALAFDPARFGKLTAIYGDRSGKLWIGTYRYLLAYDVPAQTAQIQAGIPGPVFAILRDREGSLWTGSTGQGLTRIRGSHVDRWTTRDGLPDDNIRTLYEDREGNLWIGTRSTGLVRLTDSVIIPFLPEGRPEIAASAVLEDQRGVLWLGTWGSGLYQLRNGKLVRVEVPAESVNALAEGSAGRIWIGLFGGMVLEFDGHTYRQFPPGQSALPPVNVNALLVDRRGTLWVGTNGGGVVRFDCGAPSPGCAKADLPHRKVTTLFEDSHGVVWAGTTDGLFAFDGDKVIRYGRDQGLGYDAIASISPDSGGGVWVGTMAGGLDRISNGRVTHLVGGRGLPTTPIVSVLDDRLGFLWLATSHGVVRVRRAALDDLVSGRVTAIESENYGRSDGMPSSECSGVAQPAAWRQRNGLLWFATAKGYASADPSRVRPGWLPPRASVERVLVDQKTVDWKRGLRLSSGTRQFEVRFAAARLASPEHVRFRYRMAGYDPDWVAADAEQSAHYGRLPPGTYKLQFAARDGIGDWSAAAGELEVRQLPAFYQTWWFILMVAAAMLALGWGFTHWRVLRLHGRLAAVAEERNRIAREWHDTLMAGFAAISWQLEATKTQLKTSSPEQADSALDLARSMVRHCQSEARRIIWDLRSHVDEDEPITDLLSNAARNLTSDTGIVSEVSAEGTERQLPARLVHNLLRIGQEAVNNSIRHASADRITLRLSYLPESVRLSVKDNGCGFDAARPIKDGHFGVLGMEERARKLGGTVRVVSAPGQGTEVVATLPVNGAGKGKS